VPRHRTLKAVFYLADGELVFVTIRGDLEVNEVKLRNVLKCLELRLANDEEVREAGLVAGSASALGLEGIKIIADDSMTLGQNFVVGGNKADTHVLNVNYPRDFDVAVITDIAMARAGDRCPRCRRELLSTRGIEVGHVFKLGTVFSERQGAFFLDGDGNRKPMVMGCYGIGLGRLLAAAIEQNHDEKGIVWPVPIAPYQVYFCLLDTADVEVVSAAETLYAELEEKGFEVLYDDRSESPGVKFNDADLLGMPVRLVMSRRTLKAGNAELKLRKQKEAELVGLEEVASRLESLVR
jgi:prolyl-tRNA synthetase